MGLEELGLLSAAAFIVGLSGALMPGTVLIAVILHAAKKGWRVGPLIVVGHAILETAMGMALVLGLSTVMGVRTVRTVVGLLGGVVLLWMGLDLLGASRQSKILTESTIQDATLLSSSPVVTGVVTSSVNPYFYVWWATVGNVFTMKGLEIAGLVGVAVFFLSHWMSDLSWYTFVSWSVEKSRKHVSDRTYRTIMGICGLFLLGLGLVFLHGAVSGTI